MDDVMKNLGIEYASLMAENNDFENRIGENNKKIHNIVAELSQVPMFPLKVSEHAMAMSWIRIGELSKDSVAVKCSLIDVEHQDQSLAIPSNMESFLLTQTASGFVRSLYSEQQSKNTRTGTEYKYAIGPILNWVCDGKSIEMTAIVESNVIKTIYFNWRKIDD